MNTKTGIQIPVVDTTAFATGYAEGEYLDYVEQATEGFLAAAVNYAQVYGTVAEREEGDSGSLGIMLDHWYGVDGERLPEDIRDAAEAIVRPWVSEHYGVLLQTYPEVYHRGPGLTARNAGFTLYATMTDGGSEGFMGDAGREVLPEDVEEAYLTHLDASVEEREWDLVYIAETQDLTLYA